MALQGSGEEAEPGWGDVQVVLEGWGCYDGVMGCGRGTSGSVEVN